MIQLEKVRRLVFGTPWHTLAHLFGIYKKMLCGRLAQARCASTISTSRRRTFWHTFWRTFFGGVLAFGKYGQGAP